MTTSHAVGTGVDPVAPDKLDAQLLREGWIHAASVNHLERAGTVLIKGADRPIVVI